MIRIERGAEVKPGIWQYTVPEFHLSGRSRQPLLDACRQIKRILGPTSRHAGVFRSGSDVADISAPVEIAAAMTVREDDKGLRFARYREFDRTKFRAAPRPTSFTAWPARPFWRSSRP